MIDYKKRQYDLFKFSITDDMDYYFINNPMQILTILQNPQTMIDMVVDSYNRKKSYIKRRNVFLKELIKKDHPKWNIDKKEVLTVEYLEAYKRYRVWNSWVESWYDTWEEFVAVVKEHKILERYHLVSYNVETQKKLEALS